MKSQRLSWFPVSSEGSQLVLYLRSMFYCSCKGGQGEAALWFMIPSIYSGCTSLRDGDVPCSQAALSLWILHVCFQSALQITSLQSRMRLLALNIRAETFTESLQHCVTNRRCRICFFHQNKWSHSPGTCFLCPIYTETDTLNKERPLSVSVSFTFIGFAVFLMSPPSPAGR